MKLFSRPSLNSLGFPFWNLGRAFVILVLGASTFAGCSKSTSPSSGALPAPSTWPELVQHWWQAATESVSTTERALPQKTAEKLPAQTEIERLERQHPAWKMAEALEKSSGIALQFQEIHSAASQRLNSLTAPSFDINFPAAAKVVPYVTETIGFLPSPVGEEDVQLKNFSPDTARLQQLHDEARQQQQRSFSQFLREVSARQLTWQQEYRAILESALQERVDAAAQRVPATVALILPDSEMQLEMTNLRLQLLSNLFTTPAERKAARERLTELLAQWRAALHEQELARASQLRELRLEEPARIQKEGQAFLEATLVGIRETERQNRQAALAEHEKLLEEEFGKKTARLLPVSPANPILQIAFPSSDETSGDDKTSGERQALNASAERDLKLSPLDGLLFLRTDSSRSPSEKLTSGISASAAVAQNRNSEQIRALRQLARRDAIRQAKTAARLKNVTLRD